jgi:hypothetical protein
MSTVAFDTFSPNLVAWIMSFRNLEHLTDLHAQDTPWFSNLDFTTLMNSKLKYS